MNPFVAVGVVGVAYVLIMGDPIIMLVLWVIWSIVGAIKLDQFD